MRRILRDIAGLLLFVAGLTIAVAGVGFSTVATVCLGASEGLRGLFVRLYGLEDK